MVCYQHPWGETCANPIVNNAQNDIITTDQNTDDTFSISSVLYAALPYVSYFILLLLLISICIGVLNCIAIRKLKHQIMNEPQLNPKHTFIKIPNEDDQQSDDE